MIFINSNEEVLLILRDDKPEIKYPGMWDVPGGNLEGDETPEQCIAREIDEELGLTISSLKLFESRQFSDRLEFTFWQRADLDIDRINLTEGQRLAWFSEERVKTTELAFGFNSTLAKFFQEAPFRGKSS